MARKLLTGDCMFCTSLQLNDPWGCDWGDFENHKIFPVRKIGNTNCNLIKEDLAEFEFNSRIKRLKEFRKEKIISFENCFANIFILRCKKVISKMKYFTRNF